MKQEKFIILAKITNIYKIIFYLTDFNKIIVEIELYAKIKHNKKTYIYNMSYDMYQQKLNIPFVNKENQPTIGDYIKTISTQEK